MALMVVQSTLVHSEDYKTGAVTTGAVATKLFFVRDGPLAEGMPVFSIYGFIGLLGKGTLHPVSDYQFHFHFHFHNFFYMPRLVGDGIMYLQFTNWLLL